MRHWERRLILCLRYKFQPVGHVAVRALGNSLRCFILEIAIVRQPYGEISDGEKSMDPSKIVDLANECHVAFVVLETFLVARERIRERECRLLQGIARDLVERKPQTGVLAQ